EGWRRRRHRGNEHDVDIFECCGEAAGEFEALDPCVGHDLGAYGSAVLDQSDHAVVILGDAGGVGRGVHASCLRAADMEPTAQRVVGRWEGYRTNPGAKALHDLTRSFDGGDDIRVGLGAD